MSDLLGNEAVLVTEEENCCILVVHNGSFITSASRRRATVPKKIEKFTEAAQRRVKRNEKLNIC